MKKMLLFFLTFLFFVPFLVNGQFILDSFDTIKDSTEMTLYTGDEPRQHLNISLETSEVHSGEGALRVDWQNACVSQWGGWQNITHTPADSNTFFDFSPYTEISIWYYVETPSSTTNEVDLRIMLNDGPVDYDFEADGENWISQHSVLDSDPGWNQIIVPLVEGEGDTPSDGFGNPNWSGVPNDGELNLDRIINWQIEWSQRSSLYQQAMDSVWGVVLFDDAQLQGAAPVNLVMFNGQGNPGNVNMHIGWTGSVEIVEGAGATEGTNAIKWSGGDPWDAVNFDFAQPRNMINNWATDSVQFKIKADAGIGDLNLSFWDVDHDAEKEDYAFQATYGLTEAAMGYDGTWKQVKIALTDFNRFAGVWDGDLNANVPGEFDSTEVAGFAIGNMGQAIGTDVYFDDVWTGNPEFDWIAPDPPENVAGIPAAGQYYNLVSWSRVPAEDSESYTVYASSNPITEITSDLEIIGENILGSGEISVTHWLAYPLKDKDVTYYYAVTCKDASGNVGDPGFSGAATNLAKAAATISLDPPANFAADADLSEWYDTDIMPYIFKKSVGSQIGLGVFDDDDDLTVTAYLAMDDDYLYMAFDVIDDVYSFDPAGDFWFDDVVVVFLGLYNQTTKHRGFERGAEPDYRFNLISDRFNYDVPGVRDMYTNDDENYYFEGFNPDYAVEVKVPLDSILVGDAEDDTRFYPENGMQIPLEIEFHDSDATNVREAIMSFSHYNSDQAYLGAEYWHYTWIGDTNKVVTALEDNKSSLVQDYNLSQNYPNPFNPQTTIEYSLATSSLIKVVVYNTLGQKVATLVNAKQNAGVHTVKFDGQNLTSGVYFLQLEASDFVQTRKMLLVK